MIVVLSNKRLCSSDRFLRHTVFLDVFQFGQYSDLGFDRLVGFKVDLQIAQVAKRKEFGRAASDQPFLIPDVLVENGSSTLTQDCRENFQRARIVGKNSRSVETQCDVILLDRTALPGVAQTALLGFDSTLIALDGFIFRGAIEPYHVVERLFDVHLTCNGEDDVGRTVKFLKVGDDVVTRQSPQTFRCPDTPSLHAMLSESRRIQFLRSDRRWIVQFSIVFLDDNFDLALQLSRIKCRVPQRIGLNFERFFRIFRRYLGVVRGAVVVGRGIEIAAQPLRFASDLPDRTLGGTFEEHVLDDMGDSGNAIILIEISGLNKSSDARERNGLLLTHDDGQPVFEDDLGRLPLIFTENVRSHDLPGLRLR